MAGYGQVTWVSCEPLFKLHYEGQSPVFDHLQAFSVGGWKVVAPVNLGKPFGLFLGNFSLALALEQTVTAFDEPVIRENRNGRMCLKDYFKSFQGSFEVGSECIVNLFSP